MRREREGKGIKTRTYPRHHDDQLIWFEVEKRLAGVRKSLLGVVIGKEGELGGLKWRGPSSKNYVRDVRERSHFISDENSFFVFSKLVKEFDSD